jgi:hypothetical protein
MARRGRRGRSRSGSFGGMGRGDFIGSALEGMGTAALTKRFIGAPLGNLTGAGAGAAYGFIRKRNIIATAVGGWMHDNIGNIMPGGSTSGNSNVSVLS